MSTDSFDRRDFLKGAAGSATALVTNFGVSERPQSNLQREGASEGSTGESEIHAMKNKIAIATQMLASEGIVGSSGHVSIRIATDRVLVGPSDVSRDVITADDVVMVDLNSKQIEGKRHAPDETEIHTGIYRARPDVTSVVHTHPVYSVVFSITGQPILPVHMHGAIFSDGVPVFDSVGHVNTKELGDGLAHALGSRRAVLLKMHGAAVVGGTLEEAFVAALQLEENAQAQLLASSMGAKAQAMTPQDVAKCMKESWRPFSIQKRWQFYLDKNSLTGKV